MSYFFIIFINSLGKFIKNTVLYYVINEIIMKAKKSTPVHSLIKSLPYFKGVKHTAETKKLMGKKVMFKKWNPGLGTAAKNEVFYVGGIQYNYRGDVSVRIYYTSFEDTFGRCASPSDLKIIE